MSFSEFLDALEALESGLDVDQLFEDADLVVLYQTTLNFLYGR